jgi:hypothetical protein
MSKSEEMKISAEVIPEEDDMVEMSSDEEDEEGDFITMETLLSTTLMTEDGDTVCTALVSIARQLEMQNKIIVKMLSALQKKA